MVSPFETLQEDLKLAPRRWLVTGGAGFIGSHVVEKLLTLGQRVRVLDNHFSSTPINLEEVAGLVGPLAAMRLELLEGDIRDTKKCAEAMNDIDQVIHLAALGSVPLSLEQPMLCHEINVTGTLNIMMAMRDAGVKRFVYASSSAVYGDDPLPTKREDSLGQPLSPYAASKYINEIYTTTIHLAYGIETVGFRFFNVFGPRQDPRGAYAAVIPTWIDAMAKGNPVYINGDGGSTRDFCFVTDVVQALLLGSTTKNIEAFGKAFNVGSGLATNLNELSESIRGLVQHQTRKSIDVTLYREPRVGDIRHSCADISLAESVLGLRPEHTLASGLKETVAAILASS